MDTLRLYWKAAAFGGKLGWKLGTGFVALIAWLIAMKSQRSPELQQEPQPLRKAPVPPAPAPAPPARVTTQDVLPPQPASAVTRMPAAPPARPSINTILGNADHAIYVTSGSKMTIPHPRAEELLERLDYILFVAAHRDGDPFLIPPTLDASGPAKADLAVASPMDDGGFETVERVVLDIDHGIWIARLGAPRAPLTTPTRKLVERSDQIKAAPVVEDMPMLDDDVFAPVRPRAIPKADGALWLARTDHPSRRLEAVHEQR